MRVDDRNGLLIGGDTEGSLVPGSPDASLLIAAVTHSHEDIKMPAEGKSSRTRTL
ncbi:MAG: c-type cytochrome domain-containing protein [Planctomycetaceae bacterium]